MIRGRTFSGDLFCFRLHWERPFSNTIRARLSLLEVDVKVEEVKRRVFHEGLCVCVCVCSSCSSICNIWFRRLNWSGEVNPVKLEKNPQLFDEHSTYLIIVENPARSWKILKNPKRRLWRESLRIPSWKVKAGGTILQWTTERGSFEPDPWNRSLQIKMKIKINFKAERKK